MSTALITGSTSGLGLALARELKARGWVVLTTGRSAPPDCSDCHFPLDLTEPNAPETLFREATKSFQVDLLICNAGVGHCGPFSETDFPRLTPILSLNITALTRLNHLFVPYFTPGSPRLSPHKNPIILNIASTGAWVPGPYCGVYYASKAYVYSLSKALRNELKPLQIQVSVACPGALRTGFSAASGRRSPAHAMSPDRAAKLILNALFRGKSTITPGFSNKLLHFASKLLPSSLLAHFIGTYQSSLL